MEIGPHVDAAHQRALLTLRLLLEGLGRVGQQDGRVVSEDAGEDLECAAGRRSRQPVYCEGGSDGLLREEKRRRDGCRTITTVMGNRIQ